MKFHTEFTGSSISLQFRPILHVHIDEHREREKLSCGDSPARGGSPLDHPMREGQLPPSPHPLHLCAYVDEKGSKMLQKGEQLLCCILD